MTHNAMFLNLEQYGSSYELSKFLLYNEVNTWKKISILIH